MSRARLTGNTLGVTERSGDLEMMNDVQIHSVRMQVPPRVRIGGLGRGELLEALHSHGVMLNPIGVELFQHPGFTTKATSKTVEIACVSVAALGFSGGGIYQDIVQAAMRRRLVECPLELGPHLRIAYLHQAEGSIGCAPTQNKAPSGSITVASPPLDNDDTTPKGFYLRRIEGVLWLRGFTSWSGHVWSAEDVFVFARHSGEA